MKKYSLEDIEKQIPLINHFHESLIAEQKQKGIKKKLNAQFSFETIKALLDFQGDHNLLKNAYTNLKESLNKKSLNYLYYCSLITFLCSDVVKHGHSDFIQKVKTVIKNLTDHQILKLLPAIGEQSDKIDDHFITIKNKLCMPNEGHRESECNIIILLLNQPQELLSEQFVTRINALTNFNAGSKKALSRGQCEAKANIIDIILQPPQQCLNEAFVKIVNDLTHGLDPHSDYNINYTRKCNMVGFICNILGFVFSFYLL